MAQWLGIRLPMQGHEFEPWSRKILHTAEQLSPRATTTEPVCLEPVLHNKRSHCNEKCSPQLEKARVQQRRPSTAKNKLKEKKKKSSF